MKYQAGKQAAEYIHSKNIPESQIYLLNYHSSAFDFYFGSTPPEINARKIIRLSELQEDIWILTNESGYEEVRSSGLSYQHVNEFDNYRVQILTMKFINPGSRDSVLGKIYLLKI